MAFLRRKIQEEFPKTQAIQVFQFERSTPVNFILLEEIITSFTVQQLHLVVEFAFSNKKFPKANQIALFTQLLSHEDVGLREKAIQYLEPLIKSALVPLVEPLRKDPSLTVRAMVLWVLAKYSAIEGDLLDQILEELPHVTTDNDQIYLAAALFQLNSSANSREMTILKDYYFKHYFDPQTNQLKVSLTGKHGYAAQIIGLILWEAGIQLIQIGSLKMYDLLWFIEKG
ncbi:MAG: HEAT repeat domain-containing protein [Candidatus Heimdallarchaeota archaeon]|nr:HEAT repeat domain-containing protein [Candidatus Heimdallarchaeota archaeon]